MLRERPEHRHQRRRTVDHRRVDDLPRTAALRLEQRGHDAVGQEHPAASEVADQVQWWHRGLSGTTDVGQRAGQRDVVDVVAGCQRVRAFLAPAGHPPEHQPRVAQQALVRPDAEALHHARTEALDQRVGALDEVEERRGAVGVLQIDGDVAPAAQRDVAVRRFGGWPAHRLGPFDPDHVGAHVGQHHRGERSGADPGNLDDAISGQGSRHA